MVKCMVQSLYYMHKNNIAHRDLKPENYVFETKDKESPMRLIDFGCAKEVKHNATYKDLAGTAYYIAPEILQPSFSGFDLVASDMWSVGVLMYDSCSGRPSSALRSSPCPLFLSCLSPPAPPSRPFLSVCAQFYHDHGHTSLQWR